MLDDIHRGGIYQHYKNRQFYRVIMLSLSAANGREDEVLVVYAPCYQVAGVAVETFSRPLAEFLEQVEHQGVIVPRFNFIGYAFP